MPEDPVAKRPVTTMRDIAAAAGVSQSTVSRVLSGVPTAVPIAPATRQRVLRTARELGYRPNPLARGLHGASTNLIGAVVRDFSDPFFAAQRPDGYLNSFVQVVKGGLSYGDLAWGCTAVCRIARPSSELVRPIFANIRNIGVSSA